MARSLYLPFKSSNPRTIRGAKKRGWTVIQVRNNYAEQASWLGVNVWCDAGRTTGYWISNFALRQFAFEKPADAMMFKLKWG